VANVIAASHWARSSIADCIEFAEAWNSISVDLPYILGRALLARVFARAHSSADMPPMDVLAKKKILEEAFLCIPEHRQALSTETALSYLVDRLEDICLDISSLGAEPEAARDLAAISALKEEASMACSGAVTLGYLYLEGEGEGGSAVGSTSSNRGSPSASAKGAGYVNAGLLSSLKRMRFLQSDYDIYLSVSGLAAPDVCLGVGRRLAEARASDLIAREQSGGGAPAATATVAGATSPVARSVGGEGGGGSSCPMLAAKTRHACLLMGVSPVFVEYNVISALIHRGKMGIAMEVAKMLSFENSMEAKSLSESSSEASVEMSSNAELVLSAAVALCSLVARQASVRGGRPASSVPVVETFSLTRSILQTSTVTCSAEFLGRTLDLFTGCDFVVSVYDRFETASSSKGYSGSSGGHSGGSASAAAGGSAFQVADHVSFSRDGILMSPDTALGPLLKHVLKEVQRRGLVLALDTGAAAATAAAGKKKPSDGAGGSLDLEDFVTVLQRSENHILAVRSLLSSWCRYDSKSKVIYLA
jgi:hypothetical protein